MSAIDTAKITEVLLTDRLHVVAENTFKLTAGFLPMGGSGDGASWIEHDGAAKRQMFCPISAIQAVSYGKQGYKRRARGAV